MPRQSPPVLRRREFIKAAGAVPVVAGIGLRGLAAAGAEPKRPINLLFIMTDQQRFDALGRAGNKVLKTPNLDSLARDGAYFASAYTNCAICVPARAVILTGRTIESVRVTGNDDYDRKDVPDVPTFDNVLAARGYHTEYYGKWHTPFKFASTYKNPVRQTGKHSRGADVPGQAAAYKAYVEKHVPLRQPAQGELLDKGSGRPYRPDPLDWRYGLGAAELEKRSREAKRAARRAGENPNKAPKPKGKNLASQAGSYGCLDVPPAHTRTAFVAGEVLAALARVKDKPFSLTCSFGPPHPPMILPRPYYGMYPAADIDPPASIDDPMRNSPYAARAAQAEMKHYRNKTHVRQMMSNYYGMVREIDHWVGQILAKLKACGLEDNTLVIFTSDHGEMLGDHGLHSKMVFYDGSAHIPLLMRLPGAISPGAVVTTPVSHVDLFATILDYLNVPARKSDGRSLRSLVEGKSGGPDYCVGQWGARSGPTMMVRTKGWKYITSHSPKSPAVDALYDMTADPHEMNNLIGRNPKKGDHVKQARAMKARLVEWLTRVRSPRLAGVKARKI